MSDIKGDPAKKPNDCRIDDTPPHCPNIQCTYEGMDGETYNCRVCGEHYKLYYEDMK